ncbi:MAG: hypothetical protein HC820_07240 [Hydrococcus sp. RM1_1_31]|nr:hypothetical protein [Hydrococcus sp. RM1_1_31]
MKTAANLLSSEQNEQLLVDIDSLCNYLPNPNFRVILFGCFNHGKSTLLNALLGSNTLPIDLIPTTGAAINIKYGNELNTHITFLDGTEINESRTGILKGFCHSRSRTENARRSSFCRSFFALIHC